MPAEPTLGDYGTGHDRSHSDQRGSHTLPRSFDSRSHGDRRALVRDFEPFVTRGETHACQIPFNSM